MRIAIVGQKDFGKAALDAFLERGDTVAGVFCAPEKPGEAADALREAAEQAGVPVFALPSLRVEEARQALVALDDTDGIIAALGDPLEELDPVDEPALVGAERREVAIAGR